MPNHLEEIFMGQARLMDKTHPIERENGLPVPHPDQYGNLSSRVVQGYLKFLAWCLVEELGEAMNELKNRPWKQVEADTDGDAFREEIIDVFHFFIEICIVADIPPAELYYGYVKKLGTNMNRREEGAY